ncbi:hypothetical protein OY671_009631, partial [Metschnikowia pulcherrima]
SAASIVGASAGVSLRPIQKRKAWRTNTCRTRGESASRRTSRTALSTLPSRPGSPPNSTRPVESSGTSWYVSVTGSVGFLPGFGGTGGSAGISAWVPVFNAGRLRARVATGDAESAAAMASHDKAVVTASEEVEGAYGSRTGFDGRLAGLQQASATSTQRADQDDALYRAGRMTSGDVSQARLSASSDQDAVEQARMAQAT